MQAQRAGIFDNSYELRSADSRNIYPLIIYALSSAWQKLAELKSWRVEHRLTKCILICVSEVRSRGSQKKSRNCFSFANEGIINCPEFLEIRFSRETEVARAGFLSYAQQRRRKIKAEELKQSITSETSPNKKVVFLSLSLFAIEKLNMPHAFVRARSN